MEAKHVWLPSSYALQSEQHPCLEVMDAGAQSEVQMGAEIEAQVRPSHAP